MTIPVKNGRSRHRHPWVQTIASCLIHGSVTLGSLLALPGVSQAAEWDLVWSDEFDYTGYPNEKWRPEQWQPGVVNNEWQEYTNNIDNASVSNGTLKIKAAAWLNPQTGQNQYYSARLNSTESWTYGRFEARMKLPGGWGTWPAFWLYPDNDFKYGTNPVTNYGWPNAGEIDIMEQVGYDQNNIHASTHSSCCFFAVGTQRTNHVMVDDPTTNWHTYAVEWYEDHLAFFVDGHNYFTVWNDWTGWESWPFDHNFHIILNLAVGGDWGGAQGVDPNIWPRTLEVDYVRVYKPGSTPTSNEFQLRAKHSNRCLDVGGWSTNNGADIVQWDCHGGANQRFRILDAGEGYWMLQSVHSGKCIDIRDVSKEWGARLQQWDCSYGENQKVKAANLGGDLVQLAFKHSGICMDVPNAENGSPILQWECHGGDNQRFYLEPR